MFNYKFVFDTHCVTFSLNNMLYNYGFSPKEFSKSEAIETAKLRFQNYKNRN